MISKNKVLLFICIVLLVMILLPFSVSADDPEDSQDALPPLEITIGGNTYTPDVGIVGYIQLIYKFAAGIVAGLAAIMIVIGGVQYATAAGNPKAIGSAKETIVSAIVGLVVVVTSYLILGLFGTQFTDLSEPALPTVTVGNVPDPYYCAPDYLGYICKKDPAGKNHEDDGSGCNAETVNYKCLLGGGEPKPHESVICSDFSTEECEDEGAGFCKICKTPDGAEACVDIKDKCGISCPENCMDELWSDLTCIRTRQDCADACGDFRIDEWDYETKACSCGKSKSNTYTAESCNYVCGGFGLGIFTESGSGLPGSDSPNYIPPNNGTGDVPTGFCECRNGPPSLTDRVNECEKEKEKWDNKCTDQYSCGPGQEINDNYCCTENNNNSQ